jgi:transcriptional regulatory protein LevR
VYGQAESTATSITAAADELIDDVIDEAVPLPLPSPPATCSSVHSVNKITLALTRHSSPPPPPPDY